LVSPRRRPAGANMQRQHDTETIRIIDCLVYQAEPVLCQQISCMDRDAFFRCWQGMEARHTGSTSRFHNVAGVEKDPSNSCNIFADRVPGRRQRLRGIFNDGASSRIRITLKWPATKDIIEQNTAPRRDGNVKMLHGL
jgi:hypothetical protein